MTPEELEAVRALVAAATPGPWGSKISRNGGSGVVISRNGIPGVVAKYLTPPDAAFIAAARELVPQLLELVARLRTEIKCDRERLKEAQEQVRALEAPKAHLCPNCDCLSTVKP